jgi:hypothetical protein
MSLYGRLVKLENGADISNGCIKDTLRSAYEKNALFRESLGSDYYGFLVKRYDSALKGDFHDGKAIDTVKDIIDLVGVWKPRRKLVALDMYRPVYRSLMGLETPYGGGPESHDAVSPEPQKEEATLQEAGEMA